MADSLSKPTRRIYKARLVDLNKLVSDLSATEQADIAKELESLTAHCSLLATYMAYRSLGQTHDVAVARANATRRIVRRRLGYQTTPDISF